MNINRRYIAITGALVLVVAAVAFIYTNRVPALTETAPQDTAEQTPQQGSVSLTVQSLYTDKQVGITAGETVLHVLQALNASDTQLQLTSKDYPGMGTLVTGMHGLVNGTNQAYWQYKVNGVAPQIGADAYQLNSGDTVEWFFGASQE